MEFGEYFEKIEQQKSNDPIEATKRQQYERDIVSISDTEMGKRFFSRLFTECFLFDQNIVDASLLGKRDVAVDIFNILKKHKPENITDILREF